MDDLEFDLATTALVVIDLQKGIVNGPTVPYAAAHVVANTVQLAEAFRRKKALVVLVRVDAGPNGELLLRTITDVPRPATQRPPDWIEIVPELGPKAGDVVVTKHQPSAFFGTDLEIQLRRRGIHTIVLTGIATKPRCGVDGANGVRARVQSHFRERCDHRARRGVACDGDVEVLSDDRAGTDDSGDCGGGGLEMFYVCLIKALFAEISRANSATRRRDARQLESAPVRATLIRAVLR
jgi:hypothetical protein